MGHLHQIRPNCTGPSPTAAAFRAATRLIPDTGLRCMMRFSRSRPESVPLSKDGVKPAGLPAMRAGARRNGVARTMTAMHDRHSSSRHSRWRWVQFLLVAALLMPVISFNAPAAPVRANDLTDAVQQQMALDKLIAQQKQQLAAIAAQQAKLTAQMATAQTNLDQVNQSLDNLQARDHRPPGPGRRGPGQLRQPRQPGERSPVAAQQSGGRGTGEAGRAHQPPADPRGAADRRLQDGTDAADDAAPDLGLAHRCPVRRLVLHGPGRPGQGPGRADPAGRGEPGADEAERPGLAHLGRHACQPGESSEVGSRRSDGSS